MNEQLDIIGTVQTLTVDREAPFGYYLTRGQEEFPLNESEITEDITVGETREFFVYSDRRGRAVASMTIPEIQKGTYGWARVIKVNDRDGAALDIGISREITVLPVDLPAAKHVWPEPGDELYITLRTDRDGNLFGRLATEELVQVQSLRAEPELHNTELTARPYRLLRVGSFLLTTEGYRVFVHESERRTEPRLGEEVTVRIIEVKEDGSMNGSFLPRVHERMDADAETILAFLEEHDGAIPFSDKSAPEAIKETFGMSKASFKRAVGRLLKNRRITQKDGWIYQVND